MDTTEQQPPENFKSSRLVIKNLPNTITGDKLRKLFSKDCQITDLQLKFKQGGKFRNFAFVGYKSEDEAERVKEVMNNSCIGQNKISVEFCRKLGDYNKNLKFGKGKDEKKGKDRKKSENFKELKETEESEEKSKDNTNEGEENEKGKEDSGIMKEFKELENDPEFVEFIQTQRNIGSLKQKVWQNDDVPATIDNKEVEKKKSKEEKSKSKKEEPAKQTKPCVKGTFQNTIKIRNFPKQKCKKSIIKQFMAPLRPISVRVVRNQKGMAYVSFKTEEELNKALSKDRNVFDGKLISVSIYKNSETEIDEPKSKNPKDRVEKQVSEDVLVDTGRLFVRNLYYQCTEEDLENLFSQTGPVAEVHLPIDSETKKIKGFGFVTFVFPEHAIKAFNELDGTIFQGRTLHLIPGEGKIQGRGDNLQSKSSYKKQQELENKRKSGKGYNWNSLFLNPNTISEVISERYNVTKTQLLTEGKKEESIMVRMALAETQIVNEAAKFLKENGVKLDAFTNSESARSKTVFLVKNIPAKTEASELKELLEPYGTIKRLLLPPLGVTAIVEADNPVEARAMFKKLAYLNFKLTPLYLEWAPMDVFDQTTDSKNETNDQPEDERAESDGTQKFASVQEDCEPETTILIKGLNFATTEEGIKDHFSKCGKIATVTITKKKMSDGSLKSLGYGFIQFKERKSAQKAMKSLQNSVLDDRSIELQLSRVQKDKTDIIAAERAAKPKIIEQTGNKLAVRNIPFEATVKDVKQLFEAFGQLKFVRLPARLAGAGTHRGFGFVEFVNKEEAKRAYDALSLSTHLLGRRLVLEWAAPDDNESKDGESLESATKRGRYFIDTEPSKQFKKSALVEDLNKSKKTKFQDDFDDM